jgi:3-hydroxypropanoate dehydrogenase
MHRILSDEALDILFRTAQTPQAWLDRPVGDTLLRAVWELARRGPAGESGSSSRILFVRSAEALKRLFPALPPDTSGAPWKAPVTAIIAADPDTAAGAGPTGPEERRSALREGTLRGAYLVLAARALGLDCRPIWDFDAGAVASALFPEGAAVATFLCGLGYGDDAQLAADPLRRCFDEACRFL